MSDSIKRTAKLMGHTVTSVAFSNLKTHRKHKLELISEERHTLLILYLDDNTLSKFLCSHETELLNKDDHTKHALIEIIEDIMGRPFAQTDILTLYIRDGVNAFNFTDDFSQMTSGVTTIPLLTGELAKPEPKESIGDTLKRITAKAIYLANWRRHLYKPLDFSKPKSKK